MRRIAAILAFAVTLASLPLQARAGFTLPTPFAQMQSTLRRIAHHAPGRVAMEIRDLATGYTSAFNANAVMPAASTIKIPIMVEVFRQMELGSFDLNRRVELLPQDKDWGSGSLCDEPIGSTFPVSRLLDEMITVSDNTAANMLIRLVGRTHINHTMSGLGLHHTRLADYIRTAGWNVRTTLRTTPNDMVTLLTRMAKDELIDSWSSKQMIAILEADEINTLLPAPLPQVPIAHKTGSFSDTLNDVGIVYSPGAPYVIAVMTTNLPTLSAGRTFIHDVSRLAYHGLNRFARWRAENGLDIPIAEPAEAAPADLTATPAPDDVPMWATPAQQVTAAPEPQPTVAATETAMPTDSPSPSPGELSPN
ncbi:MAG: serine hydrolase [Vulcanimicrobiaceae bacterium]